MMNHQSQHAFSKHTFPIFSVHRLIHFRTILVETGYQAGQHELLAEHMVNVIVKEIQDKSREVNAKMKNTTKHAKREKKKLNSSYFNLEKAKLKYQKGFRDWKESDQNYQQADEDGTISRNEILKMKLYSEVKLKDYEEYTDKYQKQIEMTNDEQREYFDSQLPGVINTLQEVDRNRKKFVIKALENLLSREREMVKIENKCREVIDESIASICVEKDQEVRE